MDATPAGMVDLYHSLLICGMWALFVVFQVLKPPRWLQIGLPALLALLLVSNWFWPQHLYLPRHVGRPLSIGLDAATLAFIILFLAVTIRAAGKKQPPAAEG